MDPREKLDIYQFIPPPLPLLEQHRRGDSYPRQELYTTRADALPHPRNVLTTSQDREKQPRNSVAGRSESLLPPLCICKSTSEEFIRVKEAVGAGSRELPLSYQDGVEKALANIAMYREVIWTYQRPRPSDFKSWVDTLLDPNLPTYQSGDSVPVNSCPVHKAKVQARNAMRSSALSTTEFAFDSEFEGGNLDRVCRVKDSEFHLFLACDANTKGYTQWFYFSVRNTHKSASITLRIMNLSKPGSPFARGMRPCIYSLTRSRRQSMYWTRGCYDVSYIKNQIPRSRRGTFFTLSFSYTFQYDHDTVYFAYSEPYTYTRLMRFLGDVRSSVRTNGEVRYEEKNLVETIGGLRCPMLVISDFAEKQKKKVGITARVHPGETVGSFLAEGFIKFITSESQEAVHLRRSCVFYVIPMLNPDGVVLGNTRTCLSGCDLNRKWDEPTMDLQPVIVSAKDILTDSVCFIDLHGHSKKDNTFMYGNTFTRTDERFWTSRFLPVALAKLSPHFSYSLCYFFNSHSHDKAARTVMFQEKSVLHSFTLEASFNGSLNSDKRTDFSPIILREIGWKLGEAIYGLVHILMKRGGKDSQEGVYAAANLLVARVSGAQVKHKRSVSSNPVLAGAEDSGRVDEYSIESTEQVSSGSDSDPSGDELDLTDRETLMQRIVSLQRRERTKERSTEVGSGGRCLPSSYHFRDPMEGVQIRVNTTKVPKHPYLKSVRPALLRRQLRDRKEETQIQTSRGYLEVLKSLRRVGQSLDVSSDSYLSFVHGVKRPTPPRLPPIPPL